MAAPSPDRELMSAADVGRTISRIAHQIIEKTALDGPDAPHVVLLGIPTRGVTLAARLARHITEFAGVNVPAGGLDVTLYRDDLNFKPPRPLEDTSIPAGGIDDAVVVLVDDVLYSGSHRAGSARRVARRGQAARGPTGRARRPGPPRAAVARRLRRQERSHLPQRQHQGSLVDRTTTARRRWLPRSASHTQRRRER